MDLKNLTKLLQETNSIFEASKAPKPVNWAYPEVTILVTSGKEGKLTDDSANSEIIDNNNNNNNKGDNNNNNNNNKGNKGNPRSDSESQVKPGSIIQDMKTGEYGEVISVDKDGNIEWRPVDKNELTAKGYLRTRNKQKTVKKIIRKGGIDGFIG